MRWFQCNQPLFYIMYLSDKWLRVCYCPLKIFTIDVNDTSTAYITVKPKYTVDMLKL